ncbi:hypothetical protein [Vulcanisaeta distributa]|uniref:hypothetical protein n=1 Tax=Vulcanisaeta distributa TaxID=164451 RepID=UPI0006CFFDD1|nr:hypothetical protein [Vulcanisaeta distributa]
MSTKWGGYNYVDILNRVLSNMRGGDINYLSRKIFRGGQGYCFVKHHGGAFSRVRIERSLILIGEERLSVDALSVLQGGLVGRENVKYLLV